MKVKLVWRCIFMLLFIIFILFLNTDCNRPSQSPETSPPKTEESISPASPLPPLILTIEELKLGIGHNYSLALEEELDDFVPSNKITFSSNDESVASVSSDGMVTAHREGTTTISVQTSEGSSVSCQVTVVPITQLDCTLTVNLFSPTLLSKFLSLPEDAQWTSLVWTSSDPTVATAEGAKIQGHRFGSAVLIGSWPTGELHCTVQTGYGGQLIAHRGFSSQAPENTLPAFTLAGEADAWGIETDVHCTSDGIFVCIHDEDTEKMTNGHGKISSLSYEHLMEYEIDAGNGIQTYEHLRIPTLEEYLTICKTYHATAVIELKEDFPEEQMTSFYHSLCLAEMEDQCVCISFDLELLQKLREITTEIPVQYVVKEASEATVDAAAALGNSGIDFKTGDAALIQYARSQGCTTNVWTVDDPDKQQYWRNAGIDFITTNQLTPGNTTFGN